MDSCPSIAKCAEETDKHTNVLFVGLNVEYDYVCLYLLVKCVDYVNTQSVKMFSEFNDNRLVFVVAYCLLCMCVCAMCYCCATVFFVTLSFVCSIHKFAQGSYKRSD